MNEISPILLHLKTELKKITTFQGEALMKIHQILKPLLELSKGFEDSWIGSWEQDDFNYYNLNHNGQSSIANDEYYCMFHHLTFIFYNFQ